MQRLVTYELVEGRETPVLLLAQLREIDPRVELVYAGEGRWWLGGVRPNDYRKERGEIMLKQLDYYRSEEPELWRRPSMQRNYLLGRLFIQGFSMIECYVGNDPFGLLAVEDSPPYDCYMVEDFRARHHAFAEDPEQGEAVVEERLRAAGRENEKENGERLMREWLAQDGRSHYRRSMRGRVMMGAAGMTGGTKSSSGLILPPGY
jgi:hypothetical protein